MEQSCIAFIYLQHHTRHVFSRPARAAPPSDSSDGEVGHALCYAAHPQPTALLTPRHTSSFEIGRVLFFLWSLFCFVAYMVRTNVKLEAR